LTDDKTPEFYHLVNISEDIVDTYI